MLLAPNVLDRSPNPNLDNLTSHPQLYPEYSSCLQSPRLQLGLLFVAFVAEALRPQFPEYCVGGREAGEEGRGGREALGTLIYSGFQA